MRNYTLSIPNLKRTRSMDNFGIQKNFFACFFAVSFLHVIGNLRVFLRISAFFFFLLQLQSHHSIY
ncbi:hypothetical protein CCY97_07330 [Helicobacter sp. 10-6591]|nr:hypothetical protein CCY97_07330 [Helicobacter sp. 10-6591]